MSNNRFVRLDCKNAMRWIAKGYYVKHSVFIAGESTAIAAGYQLCATCMKDHAGSSLHWL